MFYVSNCYGPADFVWSIDGDYDWLHLTHDSGSVPDSFFLSADTNFTPASRNATLTINAPGITGSPKTISITQPTLDSALVLSDTIWYCDDTISTSPDIFIDPCCDGMEIEFADATDSTYWVDIIHYDRITPGRIRIMTHQNGALFERSAEVTFFVEGALNPSSTIRVHQAAATMLTGLTKLAQCTTPDDAWDVYFEWPYAYVANEDSGLAIINLSSYHNWQIVGRYDSPDRAHSVQVAGNYAYIGDGEYGLLILDISDPSNPTYVGSYDTPGASEKVIVKGDYAYIADFSSGLQIINIFQPDNPTLAGSYDTPGTTGDLFVADTLVYLADGSSMRILNVSEPATPVEIGWSDNNCRSIWVEDNYAYLSVDGSGLHVLDISDPTAPIFIGMYAPGSGIRFVVVSEEYAFITVTNMGFFVLDVSDPANIFSVASDDRWPAAGSIFYTEPYIFVADTYYGLLIFSFNP